MGIGQSVQHRAVEVLKPDSEPVPILLQLAQEQTVRELPNRSDSVTPILAGVHCFTCLIFVL